MSKITQIIKEARDQGRLTALDFAQGIFDDFIELHGDRNFRDDGAVIGGIGRMARLWHTCLLANWKPFFQYIPIERQIERFQKEYYNVIAQCHVNGDSNLFIEFMLRQIDQILQEVLLQSEGQREGISEYVKRLLDVMEYEVPYTAVTLMELLGLKSKESFRKNYLNPAIELQLIRMTVPDKPRSRNQRYVKR